MLAPQNTVLVGVRLGSGYAAVVMEPQHSWTRALATTVAVGLMVVVGLPSAASAKTDPSQERADVRRKRAQTAATLDALKAKQGQIADALHALDDNLALQKQLADDALRAEQESAEAAATALRAEQAKQAEITELEGEARQVALAMYMGGQSSTLTMFLPGQDVSATIYQAALSELALGGAASSIDALDTARQDLAAVRAQAEGAQQKAAHRKEHATAQRKQLAAAVSMTEKTQGQLDDRVDQNLTEAASLADLDSRLSQEIVAREAAIAAELRKSQERTLAQAGSNARLRSGAGRSPVLAAEGNLVIVRGIKVDASIADALGRMIDAAAASGFNLGGNGYRSAAQQIAVRRSNCGSSDYAIWQMPASQCRPPAARPGTSMHERGLAIDFTCNGALISSYGSECFRWMKANAPGFGFRNRPGEAWHWSPNGN